MALSPLVVAAQAPSLVLSETSLDVPEAGSASYTVKLATLPTADVTVSIGGTANTDLSLNTTSLTFTTSNWDTTQSVRVSAAQDSDALNDTATLTHTATGGGYGTVSANLPVTVTDTTRMRLVAVVENVPEGESKPIRARLPMPLDVAVTITVTVAPNGGRADEYELSANTTLTIAAGTTESTGEVIFTSLDDFTHTGTRYFDATMTSDHPRVDADTEAFAVVDDDHTITVLQVTPPKIFENGGTATLRGAKISLHEGVVKMTVSLDPSDRATLSSNTLTFLPGALYATEILTITAVDNADDEPDQAVTISATVTEGRGIRTPGPLQLTIVDDDEMAPELALVLNAAAGQGRTGQHGHGGGEQPSGGRGDDHGVGVTWSRRHPHGRLRAERQYGADDSGGRNTEHGDGHHRNGRRPVAWRKPKAGGHGLGDGDPQPLFGGGGGTERRSGPDDRRGRDREHGPRDPHGGRGRRYDQRGSLCEGNPVS